MAASGFVVEAVDRWFWVTADHVFNGAKYGVTGFDTLDQFFQSIEARLIPLGDRERKGVLARFDSEYVSSMPVFARRFAEAGLEKERAAFLATLDIALFELSPYYRSNLEACGVVPLRSDQVYREYDNVFTEAMRKEMALGRFGFYVMGTPRTAYRDDGLGNLESVEVKRLPLQLLDYPGPELRFAPLWTDRSHVGSVRGMSGGPIFAIAGDHAYLFGVQSAEKICGGAVEYVTVASAHFMFRVIEMVARELGRTDQRNPAVLYEG